MCRELLSTLCENHYQGGFLLNLEYWVVISRKMYNALDLDLVYCSCWLKRLKYIVRDLAVLVNAYSRAIHSFL